MSGAYIQIKRVGFALGGLVAVGFVFPVIIYIFAGSPGGVSTLASLDFLMGYSSVLYLLLADLLPAFWVHFFAVGGRFSLSLCAAFSCRKGIFCRAKAMVICDVLLSILNAVVGGFFMYIARSF